MGVEGMKIKSSKLNKIFHCPAFTLHAKDKVGAGDTLLALLSLCIYQNIDLDFSMFIASLAAAENVKNIANSEPINKKKILKILETYLK